MAIEKERRFILPVGWVNENESSSIRWLNAKVIIQGYLSTEAKRTIRVRIVSEYPSPDFHSFLTIKGEKDDTGKGLEFEFEIPHQDALELTKICMGSLVEKTRKRMIINDFEVEIDLFRGDNFGLEIAEVESSKAEDFRPPEGWIEITKHAYTWSNASLSRMPYKENKDYYDNVLKTMNKPGVRG